MPTVTFVISDTPEGVSVHSDFQPAIGNPCSPAQAAALDIISRTRKEYGLEITKANKNALRLTTDANAVEPIAPKIDLAANMHRPLHEAVVDGHFHNVVVR